MSLPSIVRAARVVLLDFDGPVCSVFAGLPAAVIANGLRDTVQQHGVTLPAAVLASTDPFEVLRFCASIERPDVLANVEQQMRSDELRAIETATITPHAATVLAACALSSRPVAVVSNNTTDAIVAFLQTHDLARYVQIVSARTSHDAALLKPAPHLVFAALQRLDVPPTAAVFVGDAVTDIQAAHSAGVPCVGYANKPGKSIRLASADAVITSMAELSDALSANEYAA